jgi:hypothetical protein
VEETAAEKDTRDNEQGRMELWLCPEEAAWEGRGRAEERGAEEMQLRVEEGAKGMRCKSLFMRGNRGFVFQIYKLVLESVLWSLDYKTYHL